LLLILIACGTVVARGDTFSVPATVEAFEQTDLYPRVGGYVTAVNVDLGDTIKAGQELALIDAPEMVKELDEAKATLVAKTRAAEAATATVKQAKAALAVSQKQVERYKADAEFQRITLKRQQELFGGKAITDQQLDEAKNKAAVAEADLGVAESKAAGAEADLIGAQASEAVAGAQVQVAAATVARVQTLLQFTKVVAPYGGVIARRLVNLGDLVQAAPGARGAPLFTVQRVDIVRVFCDVPEAQANAVEVGTPVKVKFFGRNEEIDAKVTRLAGSLNPETRTRRTEIDLPNADGKLLPGAYAQVTVTK
jgi:multidrug resistance efflux pump